MGEHEDVDGWRELAPGVQVSADGPEHWRWWAEAGVAPAGASTSPEQRDRRPRSRPSVRLVLLVLVAVAAVALVPLAIGAAGSASVGATSEPVVQGLSNAAPTGATTTLDRADGSPDWWAIVAELDRRRTEALAAVDSGMVAEYAQSDSPVALADADLITSLIADGVAPVGLSTTLVAIEEAVPSPTGSTVELVIVDKRSGYELVDSTGLQVREEPPGPERRWRLTLDRASTDPGWGLVSVEALP